MSVGAVELMARQSLASQGHLAREDLVLAVLFGSRDARVQLVASGAGDLSQRETVDLGGLARAVFGLGGKHACVLVAVEAANLSLAAWQRLFPEDRRVEQALDAAEGWLDDPTESHRTVSQAAGKGAMKASSLATRKMGQVDGWGFAELAAVAAGCAAGCAGVPQHERSRAAQAWLCSALDSVRLALGDDDELPVAAFVERLMRAVRRRILPPCNERQILMVPTPEAA